MSRRSPRPDGFARTSDPGAGRSSCCRVSACSTRGRASRGCRTAGASSAAAELVGVVDRVADLVAQDLQARSAIAAFHFEHLRQLELFEPRVRKVERDRDAGHAVRRKPLVGQPVMRPEPDAARLELAVDKRCALRAGALDAQAEIAHADLEQLLVAERRPVGRLQRLAVGGACIHHSVSRSYASAVRSSVASSNRRPVSWNPTGRRAIGGEAARNADGRKPRQVRAHGEHVAQVHLQRIRRRSPSLKGGVGLVGIATTSALSNARS